MESKTVKTQLRKDNLLWLAHNMELPARIQALTLKLGLKARRESKFRFYSLYHHICMPDILEAAWRAVVKNNGAAGVDGVSIRQIKESPGGESIFLDDLRKRLVSKSYKPSPVKRVYIKKANGKLRPLGIPTVADRVVQTATVILLTPIFEQDFLDCSYGFRPKRGAQDAVRKIMSFVKKGYTSVFDADISSYFDNIPHVKLIKALKQRIADSTFLKLIRMWLKCAILEQARDGKSVAFRSNKGTPQGGVISPLLANIYLHWFDKQFSWTSDAKTGNAVIVRYADDFVIMMKRNSKQLISWVCKILTERFELEINREKSKLIFLPFNSLDFLGYNFSRRRDQYGKNYKYWHLEPSKKSLLREFKSIGSITSHSNCCVRVKDLIESLNRQLTGWGNYFCLGNPHGSFAKVDRHAREKLWKHLGRRSQRGYRKWEGQSSFNYLTKEIGLYSLTELYAKSHSKRAGCGKSARPVR